MCNEAGFTPNIVLNADVGSSIAEMVSRSLGVSILQKATLSKMNPKDVVMVDFEPPIILNIYLCYNKNIKPSSALLSFLEFIRNDWKPKV